jgi:hypothetical protein
VTARARLSGETIEPQGAPPGGVSGAGPGVAQSSSQSDQCGHGWLSHVTGRPNWAEEARCSHRNSSGRPPPWNGRRGMAEGEGFEPPVRPRRTAVFKTAAFVRSATPPDADYSTAGHGASADGADSLDTGDDRRNAHANGHGLSADSADYTDTNVNQDPGERHRRPQRTRQRRRPVTARLSAVKPA